MFFVLAFAAIVTVIGCTSTVIATAKDGYGRIPTRRA